MKNICMYNFTVVVGIIIIVVVVAVKNLFSTIVAVHQNQLIVASVTNHSHDLVRGGSWLADKIDVF